ncbi:MAG: MFS transporter, partial [Candidatus Aminicenantes bacterium]|nr:MFS transporter [Candidatus Aminicenantes bacterium]
MSTTRPSTRLLKRLFDVRPEETNTAVLFFLYFFLLTASAYIIIPVKISLYLEWLSFEKLPYAYLLTAVLIGFVVTLNTKLLRSLKREQYITYSLVFFIANLFIFWFLFKTEWPWLSMIFWFWEDIFLGTTVTQFWILVNDFYNPRQTKRLVGFLVSGGLLGGITGSLIAYILAPILGTEDLLLVCPVILVGSLVIVKILHKQAQKDEKTESKGEEKKKKPAVGFFENLKIFKNNRHLLFLCGIVGFSIIVATMIDFQFSSVVNTVFHEQ